MTTELHLPKLDRPWRRDFRFGHFLTDNELLVAEAARYAVRAAPGGELLHEWPCPADVMGTLRSARPPVLATGRRRVLLEPPRPAGLALVADDAPQALAARLLVCDLDGHALLALEGSHLHRPLALGDAVVMARDQDRLAMWDAKTGKRLPTSDLRFVDVSVSPSGEWIAFVVGELEEEGEVSVVDSRTGALRWKQPVQLGYDGALLAFVDEGHVLVAIGGGAGGSEAVLFDADGDVKKTVALPDNTDEILVRRGRAVLLFADADDEDRQRALVLDGYTLEIVRDDAIGRLLALSPTGAAAVLCVDAESVATFDTRVWFDAAAHAPSPPRLKERAANPDVYQWFFALPKSVSQSDVLRLGAAVHHMLDDPLRDFCILVQPEDAVRELRWFAFVARWRQNPYEYFPFIDTLADAALLLVSVLHVDAPNGPLRYAAAYMNHKRTPALGVSTFGGVATVRHGSLPTPIDASQPAPTIVLRQFAPGELPDPPYLSVLQGPAFHYRDRAVIMPAPVDERFVASLVPQIDMDCWD